MKTLFTQKAKPFIKWAGGKQALTSTLFQYFPEEVAGFREPFVGGGSVFLGVTCDNLWINDDNQWLIDTYVAIRDMPHDVMKRLDNMKNTKGDFLKIRATNPYTTALPDRAAQFIYLNKTCFRGLFRVNKKGFFNVPYGDYDRRYYDRDNLLLVSQKLKEANILTGDFEYALEGVCDTDFVYFDPPYYKQGGYSDFNRYTKNQFKEGDHFRLASVCRELDEKGIRWAMSNSNTDFIRRIYSGFKFVEVSARREINLNSKNRNIKELLVLNY